MDFNDYQASDLAACLALFDQNCPKYFAENERQGYQQYLASTQDIYKVGSIGGELVAAFGINIDSSRKTGRVTWIMVSPNMQGRGVGEAMMNDALECLRHEGLDTMLIAASHLSAPFFAKFGAQELETIAHGWGPNMHRVDMKISLK